MNATAFRRGLSEFQTLRRQGKIPEALSRLQDALRRDQLQLTERDGAGRFIRTALQAGNLPVDLRILLLGQCTTSWLTTALMTESWSAGKAALVEDGGFDNIIQQLASVKHEVDLVVIVPWHQRLLASDKRPYAERIADELAWLHQAWSMLPGGARLVQVGYDCVGPGTLGYQLGGRYDGHVQLVRRMNDTLRDHLPEAAFLVDLEQVAAEVGRRTFYDPRNYAWTKQPFSSLGLRELARHIWSGVRALTTGSKKVLVVDLDNTIWGGIVGEVGPLGVQLGDSPDGEAFRMFQRHVKQLRARGVVLAACSKNNPEDASAPFVTNSDMVLSLDDFACFVASWDPKPEGLRTIADTLSLGLDSFVFFDDNPAEREHVRQELPQVEVVEVPRDPAEYCRVLQQGLWFESVEITEADRQRAGQYNCERRRREVKQQSNSLEDYLTSLEMLATIAPVNEADMQRIGQLLAKTNQFNLTTRRHTVEVVRRMVAGEGALGLTLRLQDRFGDYGLVSVVLGMPELNHDMPTLRLDTWLMSCRAIGRTAEDCFMHEVVARAAELGYQTLIGEYVPSSRNTLVADFYARSGFAREPSGDNDAMHSFRLDISCYQPSVSFVRR